MAANRPDIYPEIRNTDINEVLEALEMSLAEGAEGVFLVGDSTDHRPLFERYSQVSQIFPEAWVGLSARRAETRVLLGELSLFELEPSAVLIGGLPSLKSKLRSLRDLRAIHAPRAKLFGEVSHNETGSYIYGIEETMEAALKARHYVDVIAVSGAGPDLEVPLQKVKEVKKELDKTRNTQLALTGGVNLDNVAQYRGVDAIVIGHPIHDRFGMLNRGALAEVIKRSERS